MHSSSNVLEHKKITDVNSFQKRLMVHKKVLQKHSMFKNVLRFKFLKSPRRIHEPLFRNSGKLSTNFLEITLKYQWNFTDNCVILQLNFRKLEPNYQINFYKTTLACRQCEKVDVCQKSSLSTVTVYILFQPHNHSP